MPPPLHQPCILVLKLVFGALAGKGKSLFDELAALATKGAADGAGKAVGTEVVASCRGGDLLKALQHFEDDDKCKGEIAGKGAVRAGDRVGVIRPRAKKLRVDVDMEQEDQEALDALRLLSSGYGAHSPKYEDESASEVWASGEGEEGEALEDALSRDAGAGHIKANNEQSRRQSWMGASGCDGGASRGAQATGLAAVAAAALTPIDLLAMASSGNGLMTPLRLGTSCSGDMTTAKDASVDPLDAETSAAIQQWGLAMAQLHSLQALGVAGAQAPADSASGLARSAPLLSGASMDETGADAGAGQPPPSEPTSLPLCAMQGVPDLSAGLAGLDGAPGQGATATTIALLAALGAVGGVGGDTASAHPQHLSAASGGGLHGLSALNRWIGLAAMSCMHDGLPLAAARAGQGQDARAENAVVCVSEQQSGTDSERASDGSD